MLVLVVVITFIMGNLNDCLTKELNYYRTKTRVEFNESYLKQDKITNTHGKIVNIYVVYELTGSNPDNNDQYSKNLFVWCSYFD